jgi:hypothetical protein
MASRSSSNGVITTVVLQPVAEKLTRNNHSTWRAQVLATLCGARLEGFITGKKKAPTAEVEVKEGNDKIIILNPEYEDWHAADTQVLGFLLTSVSKETLVRTAAPKSTAEAWKILEDQLATQTRAHAVNTRMALATTRKGSLSVAKYLAKMQALDNDMAMAGKPLNDEDLVQYILAGLDEDFDSVVNSVLAHPQAITVSELAAQMLSFQSQVDLRNGGSCSSTNFARRGRGGFRHGGGRGRGGRGGRTPTSGRGD